MDNAVRPALTDRYDLFQAMLPPGTADVARSLTFAAGVALLIPPDFGDQGYQFWLSKLNLFGGDFAKAEMVKAFIASTEYRGRFGQP